MGYKRDIKLLRDTCNYVESEWGFKIAKKFYAAVDRVEKSLVLLEVLKEQAKHSKFYSESAIQEINRTFDEMEEK